MSGQIDEFRVWGTSLTQEQLQTWGNEPLDVNAADVKAADLRVYYDFNQNSGNVQDRGANANHGTRLGFGPTAMLGPSRGCLQPQLLEQGHCRRDENLFWPTPRTNSATPTCR